MTPTSVADGGLERERYTGAHAAQLEALAEAVRPSADEVAADRQTLAQLLDRAHRQASA